MRLRAAALVLAFCSMAACTQTKTPAASPSVDVANLGTPVTATDDQRAQAAALGWPGRLPTITTADYLNRRSGAPVVGRLDFLQAFATVVTATGAVDVPRSEIGYVLMNEAALIAPRVVALESDVVVTKDGRVYTGDVNVQGGVVYIGGRTFAHGDVRLIHLKDPAEHDARPARSAQSPPAAPTQPNAPQAPSGGGSGPSADGTPWGEGVWRGVVDFESTQSLNDGHSTTGTFTSRAHYEATFGEQIVVTDRDRVSFVPISLDWQESAGQTETGAVTCQSSGAASGHGWDTSSTLGVIGSAGWLKVGDAVGSDKDPIGSYDIGVVPPQTNYPMAGGCGGMAVTGAFEARSSALDSDRGAPGCASDFEVVTAPSVTLTKVDGKSAGKCGPDIDYSVSWSFNRGPLTSALPSPELNPCADPKAWDEYEHDRLDAAVKALLALQGKLRAAQDALTQTQNIKASYHNAMVLLFIAAAGEDVAHKALMLLVGDGAVETSGAVDGSEYAETMKTFGENLQHDLELLESLLNHDPQGLKTFVEPLTDGDSAEEDKPSMGEDVLDGVVKNALDELHYAGLLRDAIGTSDGSQAAEYIEEHLSEISGVIPDQTLRQVEGYLELTKEWKRQLEDLDSLVAQGANLSLDIDEIRAELKIRDRQLADCEK